MPKEIIEIENVSICIIISVMDDELIEQNVTKKKSSSHHPDLFHNFPTQLNLPHDQERSCFSLAVLLAAPPVPAQPVTPAGGQELLFQPPEQQRNVPALSLLLRLAAIKTCAKVIFFFPFIKKKGVAPIWPSGTNNSRGNCDPHERFFFAGEVLSSICSLLETPWVLQAT